MSSRAGWLVLLALAFESFACARTTDVYVGSAFDPLPASASGAAGAPGGGSAPAPRAGTTGTDVAPTAVPDAAVAADASPPIAGDDAPEPLPPPFVEPVQCSPGTDDCDGDRSNGCEVDLETDPMHCGECGIACAGPDCDCVDGELDSVCPAQRADCNGDATDGCEVDIGTDSANCGACGSVCSDTGQGVRSATCEAAACVLVCSSPMLRGNCDGNPDNGCETDLYHDPENCSQCGMQCSACLDALCL